MGKSVSVVDFTPAGGTERPEGALEPYLRAIRARWPVVLLVTLAAVGGAVAWLNLRTPDYKSGAQVLVTPLPPDDPAFEGVDVLRSDPNESTRTVQTAAALLDSPQAAALTAKRIGAGWTGGRVESAIEVDPQGESNILTVSAVAENGKLSARLANEFTRASLEVRAQKVRAQVTSTIRRLRAQQAATPASGQAAADLASRIDRLQAVQASGDPTLSLSQPAVAPTAPVGAAPGLIVALALIGGFTLGMGAALVMEVLDRRIRDQEELRRLYPLPVLAEVPEVSRRRRRGLSSPVSTPPEVKEAFRSLQVQLDRTGTTPRVIMITSASSGDAKTTSAVNLAIALVGGGHRVVLIDFDLRKPDIGPMLGTTPRRRLTSLLTAGVTLEDLLVDAAHVPALRMLGAHDHNDAVLLEPLSRHLPQLFEEARAAADYVIVDTPPLGEVSDALRLLDLVDDVVIVARPGHTNRGNLELMRDLMNRTGHTPTGFLVIGEPAGRSNSYYAYGMAAAREQGPRRSTPSRSAER